MMKKKEGKEKGGDVRKIRDKKLSLDLTKYAWRHALTF